MWVLIFSFQGRPMAIMNEDGDEITSFDSPEDAQAILKGHLAIRSTLLAGEPVWCFNLESGQTVEFN